MSKFLKNVLEIFGVVYLRFRPLPRLWCVWLVGVNAACLFFIGHIEAQVVLGLTALAVALQAVIYDRTGFTRILGSVHILWIPMFAWMATRLEAIQSDPSLAIWLTILLATNLTSLVIDAIDAVRYLRGERRPHYSWASPPLS
ncbi:MAG: hypothetical protein JJ979_17625 [Roseibium sp.]|nr:hypothetical protein [Roseibium sp.]